MFRGVAIAGAIAVLIGCVVGTAGAPAAGGGCARAASVADDATLAQAVDSVLCLVNSERAKRGRSPLHASRQLTRAARAHSRGMVTRRYFSHVSPGGAGVRQRVMRAGYATWRNACKVGETIAWGTEELATPAELVASFMESAGHRKILLDKRYRDVGVGLVLGAPTDVPGSGATLTLDFGAR
jgi:uncharacterized protein YkwD